MKTYLCLCRVQGLGQVAFVAPWFGKRIVTAVGSHLKNGPGQITPPCINETSSTCQEVPVSCQDSYPEGVHSLMRQQTGHQMEGVIKGLKVKITSLMEGRKNLLGEWRGHSKQSDRMFSHYSTNMYLPTMHQTHSLPLHGVTEAGRTGRSVGRRW